MNRSVLTLVLLALLPAVSAHAASTTHPPVWLEIDACVPAAQGEVRRILAIELGTPLVDEDSAELTRAQIGCAGPLIELRVDDPITQKNLRRQIDLKDAAPESRARLLGLAVAELISASWSELIVSPRPKVPGAGAAPSPAARASALAAVQREERMTLRTRLTALGGGFGLFAGTGLLGGGGVRIGRAHRYHLGWWVDVQAGHSSAGTSLGEVSTDLVMAGAALVGHQSWSRISLHGGLGIRGGAARFAGSPRAGSAAIGSAIWGGWAGPMATVGLVAAPVRRLAIELGLEGGYVASPFGALVDGRREVAVSGGWIAFQIGLGIFL